jgi:hypothetical protein
MRGLWVTKRPDRQLVRARGSCGDASMFMSSQVMGCRQHLSQHPSGKCAGRSDTSRISHVHMEPSAPSTVADGNACHASTTACHAHPSVAHHRATLQHGQLLVGHGAWCQHLHSDSLEQLKVYVNCMSISLSTMPNVQAEPNYRRWQACLSNIRVCCLGPNLAQQGTSPGCGSRAMYAANVSLKAASPCKRSSQASAVICHVASGHRLLRRYSCSHATGSALTPIWFITACFRVQNVQHARQLQLWRGEGCGWHCHAHLSRAGVTLVRGSHTFGNPAMSSSACV